MSIHLILTLVVTSKSFVSNETYFHRHFERILWINFTKNSIMYNLVVLWIQGWHIFLYYFFLYLLILFLLISSYNNIRFYFFMNFFFYFLIVLFIFCSTENEFLAVSFNFYSALIHWWCTGSPSLLAFCYNLF